MKYAERDAQSIYTILISPEGGNFKAENVHILTDDRAKLSDLRREIDGWLADKAQEDDRVLVYFAGHGFMYQGKGYLAPYDFDQGQHRGHRLPDGRTRASVRHQDQGAFQNPADRRLPFRRDQRPRTPRASTRR